MTPTVRGAIRKRNKLRRDVKARRKEWLEACREATDAINEAKKQSWRDLLEDAINANNDTKLWKIIKDLNGAPESNSPNEVIVHKHSTILLY